MTQSVSLWAGVFALGLMVSAGTAYAVPLSNWNVTELNSTGDHVDVTVGANASGQTTLTFQWFPGPSNVLPALGVDMFFYNNSATVGSVDPGVSGFGTLTCEGTGESRYCGSPPAQWHVNYDGGTADGFDGFASSRSGALDGLNTGGITTPIVFTLDTTSTSITEFAAHVRYSNSCSGFVSNRTTTSIGSDSNCAAVPEPPSLLLMGVGLASVGLFVRKKLPTGADG